MADVNEASEPRASRRSSRNVHKVQQALDVLEGFVKARVPNEPHAVDLVLKLRRIVSATGASAPFVGRIGLDNLAIRPDAAAGPGSSVP